MTHLRMLCYTDDESVETNSVMVMQSTEGITNSHVCQDRVSGKEFGYKMVIQKQLETRTNVTLQNEEHDKLSIKIMQKKPAPQPKIKVSIKLDIPAYISHSPPLEIKMGKEYLKKLTRSTTVSPDLAASTADTGAQVIILATTTWTRWD